MTFSLSLTLSSLSVFGSVKPVGPSNVLSMAQLRTLPLVDQVKTLMKNGRSEHRRSMHPSHSRAKMSGFIGTDYLGYLLSFVIICG